MMIKQRQPAGFFRVLGRQRFFLRWLALLVCLSGFYWMPASPVRLLAQDELQEGEATDESIDDVEDAGEGDTTENSKVKAPKSSKEPVSFQIVHFPKNCVF